MLGHQMKISDKKDGTSGFDWGSCWIVALHQDILRYSLMMSHWSPGAWCQLLNIQLIFHLNDSEFSFRIKQIYLTIECLPTKNDHDKTNTELQSTWWLFFIFILCSCQVSCNHNKKKELKPFITDARKVFKVSVDISCSWLAPSSYLPLC